MKVKVNGKVLEVITLDMENRLTLSGYVCEDGNTYPADDCEIVKPEPEYKAAWVPELDEEYWLVGTTGEEETEKWEQDLYDIGCRKRGNVYKGKETAVAENRYLTALRRIRNVIRENEQEPTFDEACHSITCDQESKLHASKGVLDWIRDVGGIYVKDNSFAEWLIKNYEADLKILAGVQ